MVGNRHQGLPHRQTRNIEVDVSPLEGAEEASRNITFVEIPSLEGGYHAFFDPGGPGPEPSEGVRYSAPGPPDLEPVIIALDDPMRVSREATTGGPLWLLLGLGSVAVAVVVALAVVRRRRSHSKDLSAGKSEAITQLIQT